MRRIGEFLGGRVVLFLTLGALAGLALFVVELAFAYGMQGFLAAIGVMAAPTLALPPWVPHVRPGSIFAFVVAAGTLRALLNAAQIYMGGATQEGLQHRLRSLILHWALHSESAGSAEVATLFGVRTLASGQFICSVQTLSQQATFTFMLSTCLLLMAPWVTLGVAGLLALLCLPLLAADRRLIEAGRGLGTESARTNARITMSIKNLLLLQIYGTQAREEAQALSSLAAFHGHYLTFHKISAFKYAVPQALGVILICLIAAAGKSLGRIAPGVLVSYFYLLLRAIQQYSSLSQTSSSLTLNWSQFTDLLAWWSQHHGPQAEPVSPPSPAGPPLPGPVGWRLSGVDFSYPEAGTAVFSGLDLEIEPGQALVIMGPSGSGKSTLLGLLLGTLRPTDGRVDLLLEDGRRRPLSELRGRLYPAIGYVGPESFLLAGTVRENLTYGLGREADDGEMKEALAAAECDFVRSLPMGLEHRLTEQGQGLSAGQKQRLSLARALLRRPRLLILDEATSNLDFAAESRLAETLASLKRRMTIVAVTHRPTLLALADRRLELGPPGSREP